MTQSPVPLGTTQSFMPPSATQFSVFLANKVGRLLDLVERLDTETCRICALSVHEASDHAVVRIVPNNAKAARDRLKTQGLPFSEREVLLVEIGPNQNLAKVCLALLSAELSIHFAYPLLTAMDRGPVIALAVDDMTLAGQLLRKIEFRLLGENDLPQYRGS